MQLHFGVAAAQSLSADDLCSVNAPFTTRGAQPKVTKVSGAPKHTWAAAKRLKMTQPRPHRRCRDAVFKNGFMLQTLEMLSQRAAEETQTFPACFVCYTVVRQGTGGQSL